MVLDQTLVHTGQHYDTSMSEVFFSELGLPDPEYHLGTGSDTHARQTAAVMVAFEQVALDSAPDLVLVYGDVNSTVAAALVSVKLNIPVGHVEAGLRSFDRTMPEEINRLITDQIADILFTPSVDADENLRREGIPPTKIHRVGNVMIDTLIRLLPCAEQSSVLANLNLKPKQYGVLTMHRPSNVDDPTRLYTYLEALKSLSKLLPIVFPVHPRTLQRIRSLEYQPNLGSVHLINPLKYTDFLCLMNRARVVITDSGGIQEETSYLGIPCLTLRPNTERPITVDLGTNTIVGQDSELLSTLLGRILQGDTSWDHRPPSGIPLWDGNAAERIADIILRRNVGPQSDHQK
jgi:UDP-N-acetylglucosamine 2-epimerase (non-hydrolysing)